MLFCNLATMLVPLITFQCSSTGKAMELPWICGTLCAAACQNLVGHYCGRTFCTGLFEVSVSQRHVRLRVIINANEVGTRSLALDFWGLDSIFFIWNQ